MKKGKTISAEQRAKISVALRGRKQPEELVAKWRGPNHHAWKGGRNVKDGGYVALFRPGHPLADRRGYVLEHRLVMEAHLGRTLLQTEIVHHINGIPADNRIENLMLFSSKSDHTRHHQHIGEKP